jgi:dolichol-phosphate mannosyltransferase
VADRAGLAAATVAGLREARGDVLVVLDLERGYAPEGMMRLVEPLLQGRAELAVATPRGNPGLWSGPCAWSGSLARGLLGTSDPSSGLVALTAKAARGVNGLHTPIGSRFTLDLIARTNGKRVDVPVGRSASNGRIRLELNDLRHLKRLADHRFGNASRLFQFCAVGASGMVIDLSCYALFQWVFSKTALTRVTAPFTGGSADLAAAGALAIALALVWNFSLNRRLTFNDARGGSLPRQFVTYVLGNALGIALSYTLRMVLPVRVAFFSRHRLAAALVGIVAATGISFSMSRWVVFNRRTAARDPAASRKSDGSRTEPSAVR